MIRLHLAQSRGRPCWSDMKVIRQHDDCADLSHEDCSWKYSDIVARNSEF